MLDDENPTVTSTSEESAPAGSGDAADTPPAKKTAKKTAKKSPDAGADGPAEKKPAKKAAKKTAAKTVSKSAAKTAESGATDSGADGPAEKKPAKRAAKKSAGGTAEPAAEKKPAKKSAAKTKKSAATPEGVASEAAASGPATTGAPAITPLFQPPPVAPAPAKSEQGDSGRDDRSDAEPAGQKPKSTAKKPAKKTAAKPAAESSADADAAEQAADGDAEQGSGDSASSRRRRRRGGRRRRKPAGENGESTETAESAESDEGTADDEAGDDSDSGSTRRRRKRVRAGEAGEPSPDDPANTVTRVRKGRTAEDEIAGFSGSTRLEAKKQRRREGREAGRRRAPIITEAEFLARREAVDRSMVIRQRGDLTQIAVLEDKVLVEHYVARESQTSLIGNVYLGRVQNVLPSMEAAFVDIGRGRNAVLYAGEVNWDALGVKNGKQRRIEDVLKSGQTVLVQVTKDPIGHKGARLTSQISLPGRFLVYVPDGTTSGISRKLPDTERNRLKALLKEIVPDTAGVIVRTAAEGASEDELTRDVARLKARWEDISAKSTSDNAPQLLYSEPDLTLKVVRDLFTEDFGKLVVEGEEAWEMVQDYVEHVAPDLADRLERHETDPDSGKDVFAAHRIDEQIAKALDRKVWLPSGGSLIIDRTEAMTVIDVNTGKFTGSGGNLEETVTKNNLEAAEEIVRQLRLRDIGGIIVVDFIDMVLESNRDLVLRRLVECLGRDRTRHQVAEVTSLGLVQMTRKRIGTGLLEAFSETCEHCAGRGLVVHQEPVEPKRRTEDDSRRGSRRSRGRGKSSSGDQQSRAKVPSPADVAAMAHPHPDDDEAPAEPAAKQPQTESSAPDDELSLDELAVVALNPSSDEDEPDTDDLPDRDTDTAVNYDTSRIEPFEEPSDDADEPEQDEDEDEPVPATRIVTSTVRRRTAHRAAGPPAAQTGGDDSDRSVADDTPGEPAQREEADAAPAAAGAEPPADTESASPDVEGADPAPVTAHVPIKKKGSRKR